MITIYAPDAVDFSTLGEGALCPSECVIEEQALGQYSLTMTHPMDAGGKWRMIAPGCILKAPAPVRETPLAVEDGEGTIPSEPETVTRHIYRVQTNTGANLHLRQGPSTSTRILSKYRPGTEVVVLSQSGGWGRVIVRSSGAGGYMSMEYLVWVRDEAETIAGDAPSPQRVVYPAQSRMQLFRIASVERDAAAREVRVTAQHIFYDLLGNIVGSEYAPENVAASAVVEQLFARTLNAHAFDVHCSAQTNVSGDYTRRGLVECLLDPDDGVVPQTGGRLIRDNFDIWLLPDLPRETGVTIRHGKNLLGATLTTDWEDLTTRIIPVGQNSDGKPLLLAGTIYVDSPRIDDYPVIRAQAVEYDVKVGQDGINNATQARARLTELAEADFADNGVDLPTVGLDVDFVALSETEEYKKYADLEAVHLYDTVRVIAKEAGIDAAVRVTGYKWDAIGRRYESVTLGEIADLKPTVYGYELPRGSIKTIKIANGAVGSAQLRDLAVQYAHLGTAAIEQLSANSITALKAYITEIVAGSVTTDELYAGIAAISKAQLTTANIEEANIDWAQIADLQAGNIAALAAYINDLTAESIETNALYAAYAHMFSLAADNIAAGSVSADNLAAVMADIIHAEVDVGEFALAEVKNLLANALVLQAGQAGSMSIVNLVVTQANMLNATVDNLIMPGTDGKYYQIIVGTNGSISTAEVEVTEEEIAAGQTASGKQIVASTINADTINGSTVTAQQAVLNTVLTQALTAGKITAVEAMLASATVPTLYATSIKALGDSIDISANQQIQLIVSSVAQAQGTAEAAQNAADSAQEGADFATPLTGAEPPEEAPAAGKLWIDEGQTPSVWRRWRGADVTTEREYTETRVGCGKNLYDVNDRKTFSDGVTVDADGWITVTASNSAGSDYIFKNCYTYPSLAIRPSTQYTVICEIAQINVTGQLSFSIVDLYNEPQTLSQFAQVFSLPVNENTQTGTRIQVLTSRADLSDAGSMLRTYVAFTKGASGTIKFRLSVLEDTSITAETFEYEPYQDIPFLALDNAQGQIERVAVEAGCRARQAGTGDPSPSNIRAISGRESVEVVACGKNIADVVSPYQTTNRPPASVTSTITHGSIEMSADAAINNAWAAWRFWWPVKPGTNYTISAKIECDDDSFAPSLAVYIRAGINGTPHAKAVLSSNGSYTINTEDKDMIGLFAHFTTDTGSTGARTVRYYDIQIEEGSTATGYEPYRSMGGGVVTPLEPLYGLPDAKDTVEVDASGDVTVTRRTGYIASYNGESLPGVWISSHDVYAEGAAPTTGAQVVYELAVPETEALTAIPPVTPEAGPVNIWTDADALTATVRGSGWEIINDTDDLSAGINGLLDNVGSLTGALDSTQAQLTDLAAVTITRDEVESIVTSVDGRLSSVEQQAGALDVVVAEMRGDVDNIMLGVHVGTDGVGIYRDGDPYQINIDNRGMTVTEGGMETLSARESQVNANRMQVREALMLGSELALVVSPGKLRLQRR